MGGSSKGPSGASGHDYFARLGMALCLGPVDTLYSVENGDETIWEGPVTREADADSFGRTILQTDLGRIDFYWGTEDQAVTPEAAGVEVGEPPFLHSPYRGVCHWYGIDLLLGSRPVPPNLLFDIERIPRALPGLSGYSVEGEALVPDVIYDLLTNAVWGLGVPPAMIDAASFIAAAETILAEGITVGVVIDSQDQARGLIGKLLQYIGGYLYESRGKTFLVLDRAVDLEAATVIDGDSLADEPRWSEDGFAATFAETRLAWRDRDRDDERTTEVFTDMASSAVESRIRRQTINLDWVRRREVAKRVVARIGQRAAIASRTYEWAVLPSVAAELRPGSVVILNHPKTGISARPVRILSLRRGGPGRRSVTIEAVDDLATDTSTWTLPAVDPFEVPSGLTPPPLENPVMRIGVLPAALVPEGEDGFLAAIQRRTSHVLGAHIYFAGRDGGTWRQQQTVNRFPVNLEVLWWTPIREGNWLLRVKAAGAPDVEAMESYAEQTGMRLVTGLIDGGTHQVMLFWSRMQEGGIFEPGVGEGDIFDLEFDGTPPYADVETLRIGTGAASERAPTILAFFGRLADYAIVTNTDIAFGGAGANGLEDEDRVRYVRTPTFDRLKAETVDDAIEATFDRPADEYSPDWGAPAHSAAEAFDEDAGAWYDAEDPSEPIEQSYSSLEDIDEALGAMSDDSATAEQLLRYEAIDDALGAEYETGYYA